VRPQIGVHALHRWILCHHLINIGMCSQIGVHALRVWVERHAPDSAMRVQVLYHTLYRGIRRHHLGLTQRNGVVYPQIVEGALRGGIPRPGLDGSMCVQVAKNTLCRRILRGYRRDCCLERQLAMPPTRRVWKYPF
jgi:hypothetical protein